MLGHLLNHWAVAGVFPKPNGALPAALPEQPTTPAEITSTNKGSKIIKRFTGRGGCLFTDLWQSPIPSLTKTLILTQAAL
jgi:hypothetical protein